MDPNNDFCDKNTGNKRMNCDNNLNQKCKIQKTSSKHEDYISINEISESRDNNFSDNVNRKDAHETVQFSARLTARIRMAEFDKLKCHCGSCIFPSQCLPEDRKVLMEVGKNATIEKQKLKQSEILLNSESTFKNEDGSINYNSITSYNPKVSFPTSRFPLLLDPFSALFGGAGSVSSQFNHTHFLYRKMASQYKREKRGVSVDEEGREVVDNTLLLYAYERESRYLAYKREGTPYIATRARAFDDFSTQWCNNTIEMWRKWWSSDAVCLVDTNSTNSTNSTHSLTQISESAKYEEGGLSQEVLDSPLQVVLIGGGFDTRAYRLAALRNACVFEVDQRDVISFKESLLPHSHTLHSNADVSLDPTSLSLNTSPQNNYNNECNNEYNRACKKCFNSCSISNNLNCVQHSTTHNSTAQDWPPTLCSQALVRVVGDVGTRPDSISGKLIVNLHTSSRDSENIVEQEGLNNEETPLHSDNGYSNNILCDDLSDISVSFQIGEAGNSVHLNCPYSRSTDKEVKTQRDSHLQDYEVWQAEHSTNSSSTDTNSNSKPVKSSPKYKYPPPHRYAWVGALLESGWTPLKPTLWLIEGVVMYLTKPAVQELLSVIAQLSSLSLSHTLSHPLRLPHRNRTYAIRYTAEYSPATLSRVVVDWYTPHAAVSGASYYALFKSGVDRHEAPIEMATCGWGKTKIASFGRRGWDYRDIVESSVTNSTTNSESVPHTTDSEGLRYRYEDFRVDGACEHPGFDVSEEPLQDRPLCQYEPTLPNNTNLNLPPNARDRRNTQTLDAQSPHETRLLDGCIALHPSHSLCRHTPDSRDLVLLQQLLANITAQHSQSSTPSPSTQLYSIPRIKQCPSTPLPIDYYPDAASFLQSRTWSVYDYCRGWGDDLAYQWLQQTISQHHSPSDNNTHSDIDAKELKQTSKPTTNWTLQTLNSLSRKKNDIYETIKNPQDLVNEGKIVPPLFPLHYDRFLPTTVDGEGAVLMVHQPTCPRFKNSKKTVYDFDLALEQFSKEKKGETTYSDYESIVKPDNSTCSCDPKLTRVECLLIVADKL